MPKEDGRWKNMGLPSIVQPDRGADFMSNAVLTAFGKLKIRRDPDPPHYPNGKGKLERWFETIDHACFRILPGHKEAVGRTIEAAAKHVQILLTVPQLRKEIERWIIEEYHQWKHSETGRKPAELWEEMVRLRWPDSEDDLNLFLLKSDEERTVKNVGIEFTPRNSADGLGRYWAPELGYNVGRRVRISHNPEDMESIMVYCAATGKFICEAWRMGQPNSRYTIADVKHCRRNLRAMKERIKEYSKEVDESDRRAAQQAEWAAARRLVEAENVQETAGASYKGADDDAEALAALLEQFRRQDRGEE